MSRTILIVISRSLMYDFAHPIQDALEGITHSMCSLEFNNQRPLYNWVAEDEFDWVTINLYGNLFAIENTVDINENDNLIDYINPNSRRSYMGCMIEKGTQDPDIRYQFVRHGYFILIVKVIKHTTVS